MGYKNKYLKNNGKYSTSEMCNGMKYDKRQKRWKKQREKCGGYDDRICYSLDTYMCEQIITWLKMFLENAGGIINLEFYKFEVDGVECTQKWCIKEVIKELEYCIENVNSKDSLPKYERAFTILGKIIPALWY